MFLQEALSRELCALMIWWADNDLGPFPLSVCSHRKCPIGNLAKFSDNWAWHIEYLIWTSLPVYCSDIDKHLEANHCVVLPSWCEAKSKITLQALLLMLVGEKLWGEARFQHHFNAEWCHSQPWCDAVQKHCCDAHCFARVHRTTQDCRWNVFCESRFQMCEMFFRCFGRPSDGPHVLLSDGSLAQREA